MPHYKLIIQSRDGEFPYLPGRLELGMSSRELFHHENGTVELGRCAGVDYQTFLERDGRPLGAIDSNDPYYWFRTRFLVGAVGRPARVMYHDRKS